MWYALIVLLLAVALTVYVGVRQHRHPIVPGGRSARNVDADPDSRSWDGPPTGNSF